jgi:hypothetical protein
MLQPLFPLLKKVIENPLRLAEDASEMKLRSYQREVAMAVIDSVLKGRGLSFVVMFPRQSGKNELQAQIETYLLLLLSQKSAEIVKISPTWKPQTLNAMRRLERVLQKNLITRSMWAKESGYIYRLNTARIFFFSGGPQANIVGATASTLLEVDEAQDVEISKFDKDIAPMAASTNATRIFWGTAWTSRTLLHRELVAAQAAQNRDGLRRVFVLSADDVAAEVPAYGNFVTEQVAKLGRNNPMVKTQFYSEEIDAESGMFPAGRRALLYGPQPAQEKPAPGVVYAFLIDVAGEDESPRSVGNEQAGGQPGSDQQLTNPGRDSTALTVVEVDLASIADPAVQKPTYRVVFRRTWTGKSQTFQYSQLKSLAETWQPRYLAIDATGIGAGLASFLNAAFPGKVLPFVFNSTSKSKLGWDFISIIETGRFKEYQPADELFIEQLTFTMLEVQPGPAHLIKWGVPDGTRNPATGELVHDDLVLSAALVAVLDEQPWAVSGPTLVVTAKDPMLEMDRGF